MDIDFTPLFVMLLVIGLIVGSLTTCAFDSNYEDELSQCAKTNNVYECEITFTPLKEQNHE